MTHVNPNTAPGQPDDSEPRDILDIINEAVAGITDAEIEERLRETLDRAGYNRPSTLAADQNLMLICDSHDGDNVGVPPAQGVHQLTPWKIAKNVIQEAEDQLTAAQAARLEAEEALTSARAEASRIREESSRALDRALIEAAKIDRQAQEKAERVIRDAVMINEQARHMLDAAQAKAEQIIKDAETTRQETGQILADSQAQAERIIREARNINGNTRKGSLPNPREATRSITNAAALILRILHVGKRSAPAPVAPAGGRACIAIPSSMHAPGINDDLVRAGKILARDRECYGQVMPAVTRHVTAHEFSHEPFMWYLDDATPVTENWLLTAWARGVSDRLDHKLAIPEYEDPIQAAEGFQAVFNGDGTYRITVILKRYSAGNSTPLSSRAGRWKDKYRFPLSYGDIETAKPVTDPGFVAPWLIQRK